LSGRSFPEVWEIVERDLLATAAECGTPAAAMWAMLSDVRDPMRRIYEANGDPTSFMFAIARELIALSAVAYGREFGAWPNAPAPPARPAWLRGVYEGRADT
jgi:hypothetical protein